MTLNVITFLYIYRYVVYVAGQRSEQPKNVQLEPIVKRLNNDIVDQVGQSGSCKHKRVRHLINFMCFVTGSLLRWTPSHTATGPWPPPAPYYPPEWRSQLEEGARREQEKVEIDEVEATNKNGQLKTIHTSKARMTLCFLRKF